jgi:hypothetical protein
MTYSSFSMLAGSDVLCVAVPAALSFLGGNSHPAESKRIIVYRIEALIIVSFVLPPDSKVKI